MGKVNKVCFFQSSSSWRFLVLALGINGRNANGINTPPEPLGGITAQMYLAKCTGVVRTNLPGISWMRRSGHCSQSTVKMMSFNLINITGI